MIRTIHLVVATVTYVSNPVVVVVAAVADCGASSISKEIIYCLDTARTRHLLLDSYGLG